MQVVLNRQHYGDTYTVGELLIDGERICYTLEDRVREKDGMDVTRWKVQDKTAIPRGKYKVIVSHSPAFKRALPLLLEVPGFSGIRIHPGNGSKDTEGCILVGSSWAGGDFVGQSRIAFNEVFTLINTAHQRGEPIEIQVK
jgi:hypothetical protein